MRLLSLHTAPLLLILAACGGTATEDQAWHLRVPVGNADAGRAAFVDLGCVSCHTVVGDDKLDVPVSARRGPELGASWPVPDGGDLATSIVVPSRHVAEGYADEDNPRLSPMGDYTGFMTVRELADLVAYLRHHANEQMRRIEDQVGREQGGVRRPPA